MLHPYLRNLDPVDRDQVVRQTQLEMAEVSRRGLIAFPAAFAIVGFATGDPTELGPWFLLAATVTLLSTAVRAMLVTAAEELYDRDPEAWRSRFSLSLIASAAAWGVATAIALLRFGFDLPAFFGFAISIAFLAQAGFMYASLFRLVTAYTAAMSLPLIAAQMMLGEPKAMLGVAGSLIYVLFSWLSSRAMHHRLWHSVVDARLLEVRAQQLEDTRSSLSTARDELQELVNQRTVEYEKVAADLKDRELDYRRIFESAHDAIVVFEPDGGVILNVNPRACELYGFHRSELIGKSIATTLSIDPGRTRRRIVEAIEIGEAVAFTTHHRTKDGRELTLEINASVFQYQGRVAILSMNRDVTEQLERQELLLAKESAERSNRAKSGFLANMSHEIRTPMAGVIGLADLMLKTDLSRRQKGYAETIHSSALSLLEVIDDILDFSKIEAGKLTLESGPVDLREMVQRTVELLKPRAATKGIELRVEVDERLPPRLIGAPARLRQVVLNLAGNAIKFTEDGEVEIRLEETSSDEELVRVRFSVRDTGIGIPEDMMPRLFQPFTQADTSTSRKFGGSGLGLAISQNLVQLMGGQIEAESTEGLGSIFSFELTFEVAPDLDETTQNHSPDSRRTSAHILVAEDNPVNQLVILEQLAALGYHAEAVASGEEALRTLADASFDLVLMDCQMPGLDGYETTRRWRSEEGDAHLPIIALTAHAMKGDREKCLAAGMDDYLSKPFTENRLDKTLQRWLSDAERSAP